MHYLWHVKPADDVWLTQWVTALQCCCVCFLRKYDQALEYHRQALVLIPQHASTYAAIGYVHSLMGDFESAIDYFHTVNFKGIRWFCSLFVF